MKMMTLWKTPNSFLCSDLGLAEIPYFDSPYGSNYHDITADFTIQTLDGSWGLEENGSGCDSYIFVNYHGDYEYPVQVWESDPGDFLVEVKYRDPLVAVSILLLFSLGCAQDQSINANGLTASQCNSSGGEWVYVEDCPSACDPPPPTKENCDNIGKIDCIAVCSEQPTCHCPSPKPFWQNGCVGEQACP